MAAMILHYCSFYLRLCGECVSVIIIITTGGVETEKKKKKSQSDVFLSEVLRKRKSFSVT